MLMEFEDIKIELPESALTDDSVVELIDHLTDDGMEENQAKALAEDLLAEEAMTIGDAYLKQMGEYLRMVEEFRNELRARTIELLAALRKGTPRDSLPERLSAGSFRMIFRSLELTLERLKPPEETPLSEATIPFAEAVASTADLFAKKVSDLELADIEDWGGRIDEQAEAPRVRRGKIDPKTDPGWKGEPQGPVTVRRTAGQAAQFSERQIWRLPGEKLLDAVERIRHVLGRFIDDVEPLKEAWEKARLKVLKGRSVESLGKEGALEAYKQCQAQFWLEVRGDPAASEVLREAGFEFRGDRGAPTLRVTDPNVPVEQIRVSLDHAFEKAFGENWKVALDGDKLVFEFHAPNSYRDSIQRRFRIGTYSPQMTQPPPK
jgi:hypothetical protein